MINSKVTKILVPNNEHLHKDSVFLEEEEEQEVVNSSQFSDVSSTLSWWLNSFVAMKYSLYGIFLFTNADQETVKLVEHYRWEISRISGGKFCFLYFKENELSEIDIQYHSKIALNFSDTFDVPYDQLPMIVFFERLDLPEFVFFRMNNQTAEKSVSQLRRLFSYMKKRNDYSLVGVKSYSKKLVAIRSSNSLLDFLQNFAAKVMAEKIS